MSYSINVNSSRSIALEFDCIPSFLSSSLVWTVCQFQSVLLDKYQDVYHLVSSEDAVGAEMMDGFP